MAGLDPAIHVLATASIEAEKAWITGSSPVMTIMGGGNPLALQPNSLNRTAVGQARG